MRGRNRRGSQNSGDPFASVGPCVLSENHPREFGLVALSMLSSHINNLLMRSADFNEFPQMFIPDPFYPASFG